MSLLIILDSDAGYKLIFHYFTIKDYLNYFPTKLGCSQSSHEKFIQNLKKNFQSVPHFLNVLKKYTQNFITVFSKLNNAKTVQKLQGIE